MDIQSPDRPFVRAARSLAFMIFFTKVLSSHIHERISCIASSVKYVSSRAAAANCCIRRLNDGGDDSLASFVVSWSRFLVVVVDDDDDEVDIFWLVNVFSGISGGVHTHSFALYTDKTRRCLLGVLYLTSKKTKLV